MPNALEVDATGWIIDQLGAVITARVGSETPAKLVENLPFVRVTRVGGGDDKIVVDNPTMAFDCFAIDQQSANQLGYTVMAGLRSLRSVVADGATLQEVRKLAGPGRSSYENTAVRHVFLTVQLRIKIA